MILFSQRAKIEREFLEWCGITKAENCAMNVIAFIQTRPDIIKMLVDDRNETTIRFSDLWKTDVLPGSTAAKGTNGALTAEPIYVSPLSNMPVYAAVDMTECLSDPKVTRRETQTSDEMKNP